MKPFQPEKIYIETGASAYPLTRRILQNCPGIPVEEIPDRRALSEKLKTGKDPIGSGKRALLLCEDKGQSFKPFPESEQYLSCDYYTLHWAEGCNLECSYCILQAYLTNPLLTIYVNIEDMLKNLETILKSRPEKFFRIGTGQLADSLSLDHLTGLSEILVPFFARQDNALLELKTKSIQIENLLGLNPQGRTIVSWSLNSKRIQQEEEHKCASIEARLGAAQKVLSAADYRTGFHFDPIIEYPGWEKEYQEVVDLLFSQIDPARIAWISLGCLRMMKELKPIMQERFPKSQLPQAEWIRGMDGKLRYFKPARVEMYKAMISMIRSHSKDVTVYLSMESPEVWKHAIGLEATKPLVCDLLDQAGKKRTAALPVSGKLD